ncbi:MAG: DUF1223 domain-containing protein [Flavobacteriaceae bacterium]
MKKIFIPALVLCVIGVTAFVKDPSKQSELKPELPYEGDYDPIVVLELFTSQGCSSCPAADLLLNEVKQNSKEEVITLSYHVDYWNYIGWEDPFSAPQYSKKQQLYNQKFRSRSNYTPQMVVNGREHFVGSNKSKLLSKIATYKKLPAMNAVSLKSVKRVGGKINLGYKVSGDISNKNVKAVLVLDERSTQVKRGENRNRTLINSNIVVFERIETLESPQGSMTIEIPKHIRANEKVALVLLIENDNYDITGAAKATL